MAELTLTTLNGCISECVCVLVCACLCVPVYLPMVGVGVNLNLVINVSHTFVINSVHTKSLKWFLVRVWIQNQKKINFFIKLFIFVLVSYRKFTEIGFGDNKAVLQKITLLYRSDIYVGVLKQKCEIHKTCGFLSLVFF